MLSKSTIRAQQMILEAWLESTCTIYSPQEIDDGYGVKTPGFVVEQSNVTCKSQTATRIPKTDATDKGLSVLGEWRIVLPVGTTVLIGWRIQIKNRMFEVEDVDDLSNDIASVVCFCFDVER